MKPSEVGPTAAADHTEAGQLKPEDKAEASDVSGGWCCPWQGRHQPPYSPRHRKALDLASLVLILLLVVSLIIVLCVLHPCILEHQAQTDSEAGLCLSANCVQTAASLLGAMDLTADPCQDFFQYACGAWNKKHVIPEDRSSISTFEVLADQLQIILKGILEEPIEKQNHKMSREVKKLYQSCVNVNQINQVGLQPLKDIISSLGGWPVVMNASDWAEPPPVEVNLANIRRLINDGIIIDVWVGPDDRNSKQYILQMDQPHFGLPSREYYLNERSKADLQAYHQYMTEVGIMLGADPETARSELERVIDFEKRLANISLDEAERHDTGQWYNKMSVGELIEKVPEIDWELYLSTLLEVNTLDLNLQLVNYAIPYFLKLGPLLAKEDSRTISNYMLWRVVLELMPYLPPAYQSPRKEFRRVLLGVLAERNRWNMCVEWSNKRMGMAVGALFVRDNFNQESKAVALEMIHGIREAYNDLLNENHWMDEETKKVAKDKADSMVNRIGYPDYILNETVIIQEYDDISLASDQFLENIMNLNKMESNKNFQKLGKPVNKDRWSSSPAVVNAFYSPNKNDIVIPAGILQPLFYSKNFPKSLNYGGIGVVIGHEITHGFDDKGRQFDKEGNLKQWWNNATINRFREQAECIVQQYSGYKLKEVDRNVNGKMTQGENIADNGGLKQAYRAYKKWIEIHGEEELLPGLNLSHHQLFFLNYAQIWCGSMRPEDAEAKLMSSVHSPGPVRVIGPLSNSLDFAKAYNCPKGSRMNPEKKCSVW